MSQLIVVVVALILFYGVAHDLSRYDQVFSDGTDDARGLVNGTLSESDIYELVCWATYLFSTCTHLLIYFKQFVIADKKCRWWTLPTFNVGDSNILLIILSFILSATFVSTTLWFDGVMPEVFMPSITYSDMKDLTGGYPGIDSFWASMIWLKWFVFTVFTTIHLLIYIYRNFAKSKKES